MQIAPAEPGGKLRHADIRLVIGTRPEAIKLAPVAHALTARGLAPSLIVTGQHVGLHVADYGLDGFPTVRLGCAGRADPHAHVADVAAAIAPLLGDQTDLIIVQGDTSSALGGARAARSRAIPVAHVEAGLRTGDRRHPWPEEEYRIEIDSVADLLFAPTEISAANLDRERVTGAVHVTGNTAIDALNNTLGSLSDPRHEFSGRHDVLVTCHRRENWDGGIQAIAGAVRQLAADGIADFTVIVPPNPHIAATLRASLGAQYNVTLLDPCSHRELIRRMRDAELILTDSGGMQEEAPALGTPLLVLRDKTERPEGVTNGNVRLVGTDKTAIVSAVRSLLGDPAARAAMSHRALPYGDGTASVRIAAHIDEWLVAKA